MNDLISRQNAVMLHKNQDISGLEKDENGNVKTKTMTKSQQRKVYDKLKKEYPDWLQHKSQLKLVKRRKVI